MPGAAVGIAAVSRAAVAWAAAGSPGRGPGCTRAAGGRVADQRASWVVDTWLRPVHQGTRLADGFSSFQSCWSFPGPG